MCTSIDFYRALVEVKSDDALGESMSFNTDEINGVFRKTSNPKYLDHYQKSLDWRSYRSAICVQDKF